MMMMIMMLSMFQALIQLCPTLVSAMQSILLFLTMGIFFFFYQEIFQPYLSDFTPFSSLTVIYVWCFRDTSFAPSAGVRQNNGGEADARSRASGPAYHQG